MQKNIFIILLNWNKNKMTQECLTSIFSIKNPPFSVVVVDNGSTDESKKEIPIKFPQIHFISLSTNLGYATGNNTGIQYALDKGADYLLLLNNDTLIDKDLLSAFLLAATKKERGGIFGGKIFQYNKKNIFDHLGGQWNKKTACFDLIGSNKKDEGTWNEMKKMDYVCGCCLFIKKEVFEKTGVFDERFFLYWEDADLCFRAKRKGFDIWFVPQAKLWHKMHKSFPKGKELAKYFYWRNRLLWIEKNCSKKEKFFLFVKILFPQIIKLYKLKFLKSFQLFFLTMTKKKKKIARTREKFLSYSFSCLGVKDYFFHRFGKPPLFFTKKNSFQSPKDVIKNK